MWKHLVFSKILDDGEEYKNKDNSCCYSDNSNTSFLFLLLHHCFTVSYFFTYLQHIILHLLCHLFCFLLPYVMVPTSLYTSSGVQAPWLLFILPGPNSSQYYSSFPWVQCQWNRVTWIQSCVTLWKSRALICIMPQHIFCFIMSFSTHIFIYRLFYYYYFLFLCSTFYKPGFFTFSSHHCDLSDLDSCAETGDFEILL